MRTGDAAREHTPMWIMIAGPYRTGTTSEAERAENLREMNRAAYQVFRKGHIPSRAGPQPRLGCSRRRAPTRRGPARLLLGLPGPLGLDMQAPLPRALRPRLRNQARFAALAAHHRRQPSPPGDPGR